MTNRPRPSGWALATIVVTVATTISRIAMPAPPSDARAPESPAAAAASRAQEMKRAGDAAMLAGHFADAVLAYRASYDAAPNPRVLYNQGRAFQLLGQYPAALEAFERFAETATPEIRAEVPGLEGLVADIRAHVGRLALRVDPPGAAIVVDHRALGPAPLAAPVRVAAGRVHVEIVAPGRVTHSGYVEVAGGDAVTPLAVSLAVQPEGGSAAREVSPPRRPPPRERPEARATWPAQRTLALVAGGAGVVSLGVGAWVGLDALARYDGASGCVGLECDAGGLETRNGARRQGDVATVFAVAGGVLIATGLALWLTAPVRARVAVGPTGLALGGTFR